MADDLKQDLKVLKAFLEHEARDHVKFCNDMQDRRTAEYKARGDNDADYRHLSGMEETKYWPFILITDRAIAAIDWAPLAKALFQIERDTAITDQAWFDFRGKAERLIAAMQNQ